MAGNQAALSARLPTIAGVFSSEIVDTLRMLNPSSARASSTLLPGGASQVCLELISSQCSRVNCPTRPDLISKAVAKHAPASGDCAFSCVLPFGRTHSHLKQSFTLLLLGDKIVIGLQTLCWCAWSRRAW